MKDIINKYLQGNLSKEEREKLISWVKFSKSNLEHFKSYIRSQTHVLPLDIDKKIAFQAFQKKIRRQSRIKKYKLISIAAIFLVLLSTGLIGINNLSKDEKLSKAYKEDIRQLQITFPNGKKQSINKALDIKFMDSMGKTIASKKNNVISFEPIDKNNETSGNIKIDIPYGEKFKLKLSDGTMVWLNSGSSLSFPQKFNSKKKKREVILDGEAYFDVVSNPDYPFIVHTSDLRIKSVGTRFNISNYKEDSTIKTTLNEGKIIVYHSKAKEKIIELFPKQQVKYNKSSNELNKIEVNPKFYNSWVDNHLIINHMKFPKLLKKLERRYNVNITNEVEDLENNIYQGEFKDESLIETLETIAISADIEYNIKGKNIYLTKK